jgi:hypothetical protein
MGRTMENDDVGKLTKYAHPDESERSTGIIYECRPTCGGF